MGCVNTTPCPPTRMYVTRENPFHSSGICGKTMLGPGVQQSPLAQQELLSHSSEVPPPPPTSARQETCQHAERRWASKLVRGQETNEVPSLKVRRRRLGDLTRGCPAVRFHACGSDPRPVLRCQWCWLQQSNESRTTFFFFLLGGRSYRLSLASARPACRRWW